jgi:3-isopropylmalate dehydrogenase
MKKQIAVLSGDGIGPEVTAQAVKVLQAIAEKYHHTFVFKEALIGVVAMLKLDNPFPPETFKLCVDSDAVLLGAVGDPKYDNTPKDPLKGLLLMRKGLGLYANIRPVYTFAKVSEKSPLKPEIIKDVNFVVVRELTGGLYFGKKGRSKDGQSAYDTMEYSIPEIERILKFGFETAKSRRGKLTVVDKANVLETSRLWREVSQKMEKKYPEIVVVYMYVDNASQQIIKRPSEFDVIVTENTFGDILTDEASVITGSLGMLPSASIGEKTSLYEPIHGSFPKAAGLNIANPCASILSAGMLLEMSFGLKKESEEIFSAVETAIAQGYGTLDISQDKVLSTTAFGDKIVEIIGR